MKGKMTRLFSALSFVAMATMIVQPMVSLPAMAAGPTLEVKIRVSEKGFLDEKGRTFGPKHPLKVPDGSLVKLTFVFDESVSSLAIGDTHQIAIVADDGSSLESEKIWMFNRATTVHMTAGEQGRKTYRAYCIVDCLGMEHLNNLVIEAV